LIPDARSFHFGVLTSAMHMAWMRRVCGRLESRYRYSAKLVYNNFPWPMNARAIWRVRVEERAKAVLETRKLYMKEGATLADLYDPLTMPSALMKAHKALDRAVDRCYRSQPFKGERDRVEYLFQLYEQMNSPLAPSPCRKRMMDDPTD
jgi:hypothetical protein